MFDDVGQVVNRNRLYTLFERIYRRQILRQSTKIDPLMSTLATVMLTPCSPLRVFTAVVTTAMSTGTVAVSVPAPPHRRCSVRFAKPAESAMVSRVDKRSKTLSALGEKGQAFLIHILAKDQQTLAKTFATSASDKFSTVDWSNGPSGLPCFEGCVGVVECAVEDHLPGGDHVIVTGAVKRVHRDDKRAPLVYHRRELLPLAS